MKQIHEPGKTRRLKRYVVVRVPIHPQNLYAGTAYSAELQQPLDFRTEPITAQNSPTMETPPAGSLLYARLVTPLSSATSNKGDAVEAMISRPLLDGARLVLPQGSLLKGSVAQAQPARRMKRNGQFRIIFRELIPPHGVPERIDASLEGVQAGKNQNAIWRAALALQLQSRVIWAPLFRWHWPLLRRAVTGNAAKPVYPANRARQPAA